MKTTGGKIVDRLGADRGDTGLDGGSGRPIDDPFILDYSSSFWDLYNPKLPSWDKKARLGHLLHSDWFLPEGVTIANLEEITRKTFLVLEGAWAKLGCRLIDFKIEFGVDTDGNLLVADVIDNDSWRLRTSDWKELSKQLFRDNASMSEISDKYALVANLVNSFSIPKQAIVLWRGSTSDNFPEIPEIAGVTKVEVTISGHKSPVAALNKLEEILASYPEGGVVIAVVGMSNGLGPILAARTSWPIIAVPATCGTKPHDVWSSLEVPSNVPLLTSLSVKNAVLSGLNVLAQKNPVAYMNRQLAIESLDK